MSDLSPEGSAARPYRETPFERIVEVGWGGLVGVIEAINAFEVRCIEPADGETISVPLGAISVSDYAGKFILKPNIFFVVGEYEISPAHTNYVIEAFIDYPTGFEDTFDVPEFVAEYTADLGYGPTHTLVDSRFVLPSDPAGSFPGTEPYPGRTVIYWIKAVDIAASTGYFIRQCWLVNFAKVTIGELVIPSASPFVAITNDYSLKIYSGGSFVANANATITAVTGMLRATFNGIAPASGDTTRIQFDKTGFIA